MSVGRGARAFVGRARELAELEAYLAATVVGHGALVLIGGEPGIGKSRLLEEIAARAAGRGVATRWGRCWDGGGTPSYWPWLQVLPARRRGGADPPGGLAALLPDPGGASTDDPEHRRFLLFDAVATRLRELAARAPALVLLDDLHAADPPSLELLTFVARELRSAPVLIVGAYREADAGRLPAIGAHLARAAREGTAMSLGGLGAGEVARFVALHAGVEPSVPVISALHRLTGGNPFFLDELVRLLDVDEGFDFHGGEPNALGRVPGRIEAAVEHRVARLPSPCRTLLELAAVVGPECAIGRLGALAGETPAAVLGALAEAVAGGVLTVEGGPAARMRFRHGLFREVLLRALSPARRAALHREVGALLRAEAEERLSELAHHFLEAAEAGGDVGLAVDYARRAAAEATERVAYEDATAFYLRALSVLGMSEAADPLLHGTLLVELGEAHLRGGALGEARAAFEHAVALARRLETAGSTLARAALGIAGAGPQVGRVDPAVVALLEDALAAVGPGDCALRARLLARLDAELTHATRDPRRGELSRTAVAMAERLGDLPALGAVLVCRHTVLAGPGNAAERAALASAIVALGRDAGNRELEAEGHGWRLVARLELGDVGGVDEDQDALGRLAAATRHPRYRWLAAMFRAMRALVAARIDDAERLLEDALAAGRRHGDPNVLMAHGAQLLVVRRAQGRLPEVVRLMHEVMGGYAADPTWESGMAYLQALLGEVEAARARFRPAYETFLQLPRDVTWLLHLNVLGETCALLSDRERAAVLLERLLPYADQVVVAAPGAVCYGAAARVAGLLAATLERWDEGLAHLERAARLNERIGALGWLAETTVNQAAVLLARDAPGDREAARDHLARGRALANRLGLLDVAERVERLTSRLDARDGGERAAPAPQRFRLEGDYWRVEFGGRASSLGDSKGVRILVELLRRPGEQQHVANLVAAVTGRDPVADPAALSLAECERQRVSVTRALRAALDRLARGHPDLGTHLARTVRTGAWCVYDPDPRVPTTWEL